MSELAEYLTLSRGGITKLVDRLEQGAYLERIACSEDRRSLQAELTPAGEELLEEMRAIYRGEVERHLASLTAQEAKLITGALAKVTDSTCDAAEGREPAAEAA